ncbi:MAG: class I SAM-dependent methyltransferase [Planctomycetes bacterium]|nr:class I SAM-dependent methyltransferase [Planctomycetota bacterium]
MTTAGDSYDALPYPSYPFALTHPDRLHVLASLAGLSPAPVERARVLEVGCAAGGNLIPIAVDLPGARCVGVDASRRQVDEGRAVVAALGLENCELLHGDIAELGPGLGTFDYVVCHGVYSWVPRHVQDAILGLCGRQLAPDGVAYVSYNTFPGWRMRSMIRDMMRYHARQFDEPRTAVAQARRLLDYLAKNAADARGPYAALLEHELSLLRRQSDAYLFHEHLEATNEPLYLHQFVERAEAAGLAYLGEASLGETRRTLSPELADDVGRGSPAAVQVEQYRDFVINRSFRTSMLVRADRPLRAVAAPEDVTRFLVAARAERRAPREDDPPAPPDTPPGPEFMTLAGKVVRVHLPLVVAALEALDAAWPRALAWDELEAATARGVEGGDEGGDPTTLRARLTEQVLELFADDHLELRPRQPAVAERVTERPRGHPLARLHAEAGLVVTNARHEPHELDRLERELLRACDGARDHAALAAALVEAAQAERLEVTKDGAPMTDPAELGEVFERVLPGKLRGLWRRSLLVG